MLAVSVFMYMLRSLLSFPYLSCIFPLPFLVHCFSAAVHALSYIRTSIPTLLATPPDLFLISLFSSRASLPVWFTSYTHIIARDGVHRPLGLLSPAFPGSRPDCNSLLSTPKIVLPLTTVIISRSHEPSRPIRHFTSHGLAMHSSYLSWSRVEFNAMTVPFPFHLISLQSLQNLEDRI
jgi:hypothetical protein